MRPTRVAIGRKRLFQKSKWQTREKGGKVFIVNGQPTDLDRYAAGVYRDLAEFADAVSIDGCI